MNIRKANSKDIDQIYQLFLEMIKSEDFSAKKVDKCLLNNRKKRQDFISSAKKELLKEFKEKNSIYLITEINNKIVGYVRGFIIENKDPFFNSIKIGYLNALVVLKKYNGKGIGSLLYKEIENYFKKNKCKQIHLEVFENNPAITIYKKWGYKSYIKKMVKKI